MIGILVRMTAKPGREEAFETVALEMVRAVRANEPGNLFFSLFRTPRRGEYVLIERWKDQAALDQHRAAGHTAPFRPRFSDVLQGPAQVTQYDEIAPA